MSSRRQAVEQELDIEQASDIQRTSSIEQAAEMHVLNTDPYLSEGWVNPQVRVDQISW